MSRKDNLFFLGLMFIVFIVLLPVGSEIYARTRGTKKNKGAIRILLYMVENPVRHINTLRQMDDLKHEYQIRCSHYELEFLSNDMQISCTICSKKWSFIKEEGFSKPRKIYMADKDN